MATYYVTEPFETYVYGDRIVDPAEITRISGTRFARNIVAVEAVAVADVTAADIAANTGGATGLTPTQYAPADQVDTTAPDYIPVPGA